VNTSISKQASAIVAIDFRTHPVDRFGPWQRSLLELPRARRRRRSGRCIRISAGMVATKFQ